MQLETGKTNRWLRRSRVLLMGALAMGSVCGARLWAQSNVNAPQSAEEAAKTFVLLISGNAPSQNLGVRELVDDSRLQNLDAELQERLGTRLYRFAQFNALGTRTLLSSDKKRANVTVENIVRPKPLPPVACVQTATGWKVDLVETARNWLGSDDTLIKEIDVSLSRPTPPVSQVPTTQNPVVQTPIDPAVKLAADNNAAHEVCRANLRALANAMTQYVQDYDEKLPPADKWADVLQPYVKNERVLHCPVLGPNGYGYAMNWKLSKRSLSEIQSPTRTVVFYETNVPKRNANYDGRDVIFRHQLPTGERANFAYLDGSVESHSANEPQNFRLVPQR